jgi:hypothetical protein
MTAPGLKPTFGYAGANDRKVRAFAIPRLLVETSTGHERMSEAGERATTAKRHIVGLR